MSRVIIGVVGPGEKATDADLINAYEVGALCANRSHLVLTGGRPSGVMEAALKGAKEAGGETIGIIPSESKSDASKYADIVIVSGMGNARNSINILSSDVVIACGIEAGTLSEIALGIKACKTVILLTENTPGKEFLTQLGKGYLLVASNAEEAIQHVDQYILHYQ